MSRVIASATMLVVANVVSWTPSLGFQLATGNSGGSTLSTFGTANDRDRLKGEVLLRRLAGCVYNRHPELARQLLASQPGTSVEDHLVESARVRMGVCMTDVDLAVRLNTMQLRGAMAELAFKDEFRSFDPALPHVRAELPMKWSSKHLSADIRLSLEMATFANCVVAADPVHAEALTRSTPRGADETRTIDQLRPFLGPCFQNGSRLTVDAASLRAAVAQGLYRSAVVWRDEASSSAGRH